MIEFGFPTTRVYKTEKFPNTPVITFEPDPGANSRRRFRINTRALTLLGISNDNEVREITFAFGENELYVANAVNVDTPDTFNVTKTKDLDTKQYTFASKKLFDFIVDKGYYGFDGTAEKYLQLEVTENPTVFKLVSMDIYPDSINVETVEEVEETEESESLDWTNAVPTNTENVFGD